MKKEVWKDIAGYEGLYQISNYGRIKSVSRIVLSVRGKRKIKSKILKTNLNKHGYYRLVLQKGKKKTNKRVHRLVAFAFCKNPNNYNLVMHLNGDKQNNYSGNLMFGTNQQNTDHMLESRITDKRTLSNYEIDVIKDCIIKHKMKIKTLSRVVATSRECIYRALGGYNYKTVM